MDLPRATLRQLRRISVVDRQIGRLLFRRDLRKLNDVLAQTPLAGRYWVWGGVLLGWARDGDILDDADADFGIRSTDTEAFEAAVPALEQAGFRRIFRFQNNAGEITEHSFLRHGAKFDFFFLFPCEGSGERRYFTYAETPEGWVEQEGRELDQPLEPFRFLRRDWLKAKDHKAALTASYGDWRTPDPDWSYADDLGIVARRPWKVTDFVWR
jgi:hypothetical protein